MKYKLNIQKEDLFDFGVREHAIAGICNGVAAGGGCIPFCATLPLSLSEEYYCQIQQKSLLASGF